LFAVSLLFVGCGTTEKVIVVPEKQYQSVKKAKAAAKTKTDLEKDSTWRNMMDTIKQQNER